MQFFDATTGAKVYLLGLMHGLINELYVDLICYDAGVKPFLKQPFDSLAPALTVVER